MDFLTFARIASGVDTNHAGITRQCPDLRALSSAVLLGGLAGKPDAPSAKAWPIGEVERVLGADIIDIAEAGQDE
jgi:hypothetical protein